jgi:hypothetical protein
VYNSRINFIPEEQLQMQKKSWFGTETRYTLIPLLAGLAVTLACSVPGVPGLSPQPTPTLFVLPGSGDATGGDTSPSGGDDSPLSFFNADQSNLTSFRARFTFTYNGTDSSGAPQQGTFTMDQAHTVNPAATYMKWDGTSSNTEGTNGNFEMTQIGETTFMISEVDGTPQCIAMSNEGATPSNTNTSPDSFLTGSDLSNARRIFPDELINGVMTRHYQFDHNEVVLSYSTWSNYTVDVWNAIDGNYTVRAKFVGDGNDFTFNGGTGHVEWTYDVTEINGAFTIEAPQGCEVPAGADFPKMPDATGSASFGSMVSYNTASPTADVVAFYNAQLPPLGWAPGEANTTVPGTATLTFTKDGKTASITIIESGGTTSVLINIE